VGLVRLGSQAGSPERSRLSVGLRPLQADDRPQEGPPSFVIFHCFFYLFLFRHFSSVLGFESFTRFIFLKVLSSLIILIC
jgi:hypothetical protein